MTLEVNTKQPRKYRGLFFNLLAVFAAIFGLVACSNSNEEDAIRFGGETMGTTYNIVYIDSANRTFDQEVDSVLVFYNSILSTYDPNSTISAFNNSEVGISLSEPALTWFSAIITTADDVYDATDGAFNIAIGPTVKYWGFYDKETSLTIVPGNSVIDSLINITNWQGISLKGDSILKAAPAMTLDVNSIAPGHACDVLGAFFEAKGIDRYIIEIGGEIRARGLNAFNKPWTVGIRQPEELSDEMAYTISLNNKSLATSGNYNKYIEINGVKLGHTIDPRIAKPAVNELLSATITAKDAITADAFATACMVLGLEDSKLLLEANNDLEGYLIYSDNEGYYKDYKSSGLKNK